MIRVVLAALVPFCPQPIDHAIWTDEPLGARIHVYPSGCGRRTSWLAPEAAFRATLAAGGRDPVNRRSLFLQFRCHAFFAPAKRSWNLETWRPQVTSKEMVTTLCNPTGGDAADGIVAAVLRVLRSAPGRR